MRWIIALSLLSLPAHADVPRVTADIAPIHALAARVMDGVGTPDLILPPGASPHGYALRPSEAGALERADLVLWVGPELTPWLPGPLETLAADAEILSLLQSPGTRLLDIRIGAGFEPHDHGSDHGHGHGHDDEHAEGHSDDHSDDHGHDHSDDHSDDHGHDDDHAEADSKDHDHDKDHSHAEDHAEDHGHDHGLSTIDPHAWLHPENGAYWLGVMAEKLSALDPENAAQYAANAAAGQAEIAAATAEAKAILAPHLGTPYVVFHDAYQYFEGVFGMPAAGAITTGSEAGPSPARIAEIRDVIINTKAACVFSEAEFNPALIDTVFSDGGAGTAVIDPLGTSLPGGADMYPNLLRALATDMAECFASVAK